MTDVGGKGAQYSAWIDSVMLIEATVFGRQHRMDEMCRDLTDGNKLTTFAFCSEKQRNLFGFQFQNGYKFIVFDARDVLNPVFVKHGVIHYCVPNIASRVARTASIALSNVFAPLILGLGELGTTGKHLKENVGLRKGVYMYNGILTNEAVGQQLGIPSKDIDLLMAAF